MAKKEPTMKTKRLQLQPMTDAEMEQLIADVEDPELKKAYGEMLAGSREDPANRLFYAAWKISLKKEGTPVGDLCFKGPVKHGAVEIGYGIDSAYQDQGYGTEAVKTMVEWAFTNEDIFFVEAETESGNEASQKLLQKLGFQPDGTGEEGPRFVKERPQTSWMSIYMCLGLSVGMSMGVASDHMSVGMCIGICVGMALGAALDSSWKKRFEAARAERQQARNS